MESADADICVVKTDGTALKTLAGGTDWQDHPSWSPDGSRIVYDGGPSTEYADMSIRVMKADGSGKARLTGPGEGVYPHWSPDGKRIVYLRYGGEERLDDIWVMNADGSGARCVVGLKGYESDPSWTPSGKVLYCHNGNTFEVHLDGSGRVQLTNGTHIGDSGNALSPDGRTLAYLDSREDAIVALPVRDGGAPVTLFDQVVPRLLKDPENAYGAGLSWTADGHGLTFASADCDLYYGSPLFIVNADGSGLTAVPGIDNAIDPAWRPE
jgi:TolB protein